MAMIIPLLLVAGAWVVAVYALEFRAGDAAVERMFVAPTVTSLREPYRRMRRKRFCVFHNPAAGRNGVTLTDRVVTELRKHDAEVQIFELTNHLPPITEISQRYDAVVVSGGDGSFRSVAATYAPTVPIALIPNGTGNVLANELGLSRNAKALAELFLWGPTRNLQGGTVSDEPFLLMFGAGFDGEVVRDVSRPALQTYGKLAYAGPILRALLRKPRVFDIETDGEKSRASWMLVTNVSRYGGRFRLTDKTNIDVPGLIAIVSRATTRRQRLAELLRLIVGTLPRAPTIDIKRVEQAAVLTPGIPAQIDGEPVTFDTYSVRRGGFEATIVAPQS